MDSEKLIETLRQHGVSCVRAYGRYCSICDEAATALSTLQAENEKLRAEMKQERAHRLHAEQHADAFLEDCKRLNAELENYRKGHCSEGGCAAEKDRDAVLAELEQVKRCIEIIGKQRDSAIKELENYMVQDVLDGNEPCGICAKASDIPCEHCNPKWHGPEEEN